MKHLKKLIKAVLPAKLLDGYRKRKLEKFRQQNELQSTQQIFTNIYESNMWGGEQGSYCSGSGSQYEVAKPYCEMVRNFITERGVKTVLDIGCGDFSVGQHLQLPDVKYTGIDIVQGLIDRNQKSFGTDHIDFKCVNAIEESLPPADLVLIRQVLQHLSNTQIALVLDKLKGYQYVMVTEHYPSPVVRAVPNLDKPHGGDTRIPDNSAVYLDQPPYNINGVSTVLEVPASSYLAHEGESIKTVLIVNQS